MTKYCSYGRDVASENPDGDAPKIFETPFKIENEDQTAKENLEDHEKYLETVVEEFGRSMGAIRERINALSKDKFASITSFAPLLIII